MPVRFTATVPTPGSAYAPAYLPTVSPPAPPDDTYTLRRREAAVFYQRCLPPPLPRTYHGFCYIHTCYHTHHCRSFCFPTTVGFLPVWFCLHRLLRLGSCHSLPTILHHYTSTLRFSSPHMWLLVNIPRTLPALIHLHLYLYSSLPAVYLVYAHRYCSFTRSLCGSFVLPHATFSHRCLSFWEGQDFYSSIFCWLVLYSSYVLFALLLHHLHG